MTEIWCVFLIRYHKNCVKLDLSGILWAAIHYSAIVKLTEGLKLIFCMPVHGRGGILFKMVIIVCSLFYPLLLHVYHCIGFQDTKQAWCQINISLLKTTFVLLDATRNYFKLSGVIGNMSGIC